MIWDTAIKPIQIYILIVRFSRFRVLGVFSEYFQKLKLLFGRSRNIKGGGRGVSASLVSPLNYAAVATNRCCAFGRTTWSFVGFHLNASTKMFLISNKISENSQNHYFISFVNCIDFCVFYPVSRSFGVLNWCRPLTSNEITEALITNY